jgi:hypothetical protein
LRCRKKSPNVFTRHCLGHPAFLASDVISTASGESWETAANGTNLDLVDYDFENFPGGGLQESGKRKPTRGISDGIDASPQARQVHEARRAGKKRERGLRKKEREKANIQRVDGGTDKEAQNPAAKEAGIEWAF